MYTIACFGVDSDLLDSMLNEFSNIITLPFHRATKSKFDRSILQRFQQFTLLVEYSIYSRQIRTSNINLLVIEHY